MQAADHAFLPGKTEVWRAGAPGDYKLIGSITIRAGSLLDPDQWPPLRRPVVLLQRGNSRRLIMATLHQPTRQRSEWFASWFDSFSLSQAVCAPGRSGGRRLSRRADRTTVGSSADTGAGSWLRRRSSRPLSGVEGSTRDGNGFISGEYRGGEEARPATPSVFSTRHAGTLWP